MMCDPERIIFQLQKKRFEAFKSQDSEDDDFDVVFDIDGKKLYAHKFMLSLISPTFKSMLSDRWTKLDEPVKIEEYTFEEFKEFITFIYSGKCQLTTDNIFHMVDMAEFYGIQELKDVCEEYLIKTELNLKNVHQMVEFACKYSMDQFKIYLDKFITENFVAFFKSDQFQSLQKTTVKELVERNQGTYYQEEFFEGIFKWAENRAIENQKLNSNVNEAIKEELSEILPLIKFERMDSVFFIKFVAKKLFLFSADKFSDILWDRKTKSFVKVIDGNGKIMKGEIQCDDIKTVTNAINDVQYQCCRQNNSDYFDWATKEPVKPSTPSKLNKNDKTEWYLVIDKFGDLAIRRIELGEEYYLLAEMSAENEFIMSNKCKIEAFSCA